MKETSGFLSPTVLLTIVLVIAAALRFYELGAESLWNDELASWAMSDVPSVREVLDHVRSDVHPPGYQLLLYYVMLFFGNSEAVMRLPSAIAGVLVVLLIFFVGKRLYATEVGLVAASILAISYNPIFYAQEARSNSILLLTTLVCSYLWFEIVTSFSERRASGKLVFLGYCVSAAVACYVHYFGLLLVTLQGLSGIVVLHRKPKEALRLSGIYLVIFLLFLPWIPSMIGQMALHREIWIPEPSFHRALWSLFLFSYKVPTWTALLLLVPVYLIFVVRLGSSLVRKDIEAKSLRIVHADVFLLLWVALPFVASYVQSRLLTPVLTDRNLIMVLPPIYLILASTLHRIRWVRARRVGAVIVVAGLAYSTIGLNEYYGSPKKEQFREAARFVLERDEGLPIISFTTRTSTFEYYFSRMGSSKKVGLVAGFPEDIPRVEDFLAKERTRGFWYMAGHRIPDPEFLAYLDETYKLVTREDFYYRVSVRRYEPR